MAVDTFIVFAASGDDVMTRLGDLARLREAGVLSPEEFEAAKAKLLSRW
jgi:hypothetical protein